MTAPPPTTSEPSTPPPTTRITTFEEEITEYASIIGPVFLILILTVITLVVLVAVIFIILRKQNKVIMQKSQNIELTRVYDEVLSRDIAVTPLVHVEVNERGRFRRRTMDTLSEHNTQRTRAVSFLTLLLKHL